MFSFVYLLIEFETKKLKLTNNWTQPITFLNQGESKDVKNKINYIFSVKLQSNAVSASEMIYETKTQLFKTTCLKNLLCS